MHTKSVARFASRAALAGVISLVIVGQVRGAPSDPFGGAVPSFQTAAPKATSYDVGDHGVSEQRGAATYAFPIVVPAGRNGMEPKLALTYSSQAPLHGGVAAGWTLELPIIERDPTAGAGPERWRTNLSGNGRLVAVPDIASFGGTTYRAEYDPSWVRYEKVGTTKWIARSIDGVTHHFELKAGQRYLLTRQVDRFGNTVEYTWSAPINVGPRAIPVRRLTEIAYTSNTGAALQPHAKVTFTYGADTYCTGAIVPKGAQLDMHGGAHVDGAWPIDQVVTWVKDTPSSSWRDVRTVKLTYDQNALACGTSAPLRLLTKIDVTAKSQTNTTILPPITFAYGAARAFAAPRTISGEMATAPERGRHGPLAGLEKTLMDVNGDGRPDLARATTMMNGTREMCAVAWRKGLGGGAFEAAEQLSMLPTAYWRSHSTRNATIGERCSLNGQVFRRYYFTTGGVALCQPSNRVGYHFLDWDGDGDLDLLTNAWTDGGTKLPELDSYAYVDNEPGGGGGTCGKNAHRITDQNGKEMCECDAGFHHHEGTVGCQETPAPVTNSDPLDGFAPTGPQEGFGYTFTVRHELRALA